MGKVLEECKICGLRLLMTDDPDDPIVHQDGGNLEVRRIAVLAHTDYLDTLQEIEDEAN